MEINYTLLTENNNWIVLIFILILSLLVVLKRLYNPVFNEQLKLLNSSIGIFNLKRVYTSVYNFYNISFIIILCLLLAFIALIKMANWGEIATINSGFYLYLKYAFYFVIYFFVKHLSYYLFSLVFNLKDLILKTLYIKTTYLNFISLYFLCWLAYIVVGEHSSGYVLNIFYVTSLFLVFYLYYILVKYNLKLISKNIFYFILYLCALEIAPLIIFFKMLFLKV